MSDPALLNANSLNLLPTEPFLNSHTFTDNGTPDLGLLSISTTAQPLLSLNYGFDVHAIDQALTALSSQDSSIETDQAIVGINYLTGLPKDYVSPSSISSLSIESVSPSITTESYGSVTTSFTNTQWATQQGGFGNEQKWLVGDFNGDGEDDLANVFNDAGKASIDVHLSNGSSFTNERWATQQGGFWNNQKWLVGDFNGDGEDDLAKVFNESNQASIDVHLSNGSSFTIRRWATQQGGFGNEQKWLTGDFNSDGQDELANVFNDTEQASIDVHLSNGSSFTNERWATQQGGFGNEQKWLAGDFNGDGRDDLANVFNDAGQASIDVYPTNSSGNYSSLDGYGLVNAAAAVARAIGQPIFADIPDLGGTSWGADLIKAPEVWTKGYTGQGVVVAVLDTGVDHNHSDLNANIWTNSREIPDNGIDDDANGYIDDFYGWNFIDNNNNTLDVYGHGTHVAGTIAAVNNDFGVTGIAYNAKIMPVKVLGDDNQGTYSAIVQGVYYAVNNGAKVINISISGTVGDAGLETAIQYASSQGVIVVMAAGNSGDSTPLYPAYYATNWGLAAGAVDSNNNLADFSNRSGTDSRMAYVTAPGVTVYSTLPNETYGFYNGTSMAAPYVAAVAALMLSANGNLTGEQVREIITGTAVNV